MYLTTRRYNLTCAQVIGDYYCKDTRNVWRALWEEVSKLLMFPVCMPPCFPTCMQPLSWLLAQPVVRGLLPAVLLSAGRLL